jgi:phosphoribosylformylglycinamidine synthase
MGFQQWRGVWKTQGAPELRQAPADAAEWLWSKLRGRKLNNVKFVRQHAIGGVDVDFCSTECKLAIVLEDEDRECGAEEDAARTEVLKAQGFVELRFTNAEVLEQWEAVLGKISVLLRSRAKLAPDAHGTP